VEIKSLFFSNAAFTVEIFRASPASSTPVPLPQTSSGGWPVIAHMRAAADVVLPMPSYSKKLKINSQTSKKVN
jgi:hypothetical protein